MPSNVLMERIAKSISNGRKVERLTRKNRRKNKKGIQERKAQNKIKKGLQNTIKRGREESKLKQLELDAPKGLTFMQRKALAQASKIEEGHLKSMFNKSHENEFIYNGRPVNGPYIPKQTLPEITYGLDQEYSPPYDPVQGARDRAQKELAKMGDLAITYQTILHGDNTKEYPLYNPHADSPYRPLETDIYRSDSPLFSSDKPKEKKRPPPVRRSTRIPTQVQRLQISESRTRPKPVSDEPAQSKPQGPKPRTRKNGPAPRPGQAKPTPRRPKASRRKPAS